MEVDKIKQGFNYHGVRSYYARWARHLHSWNFSLLLLAIVLVAIGAGLLVISEAIGWGFIGMAAVPYVIRKWYRGELQPLPPRVKEKGVEGILEGEILAYVPQHPAPVDLATAITLSREGQFFAARFGVSGNFLQQLVSHDPMATEEIWRSAQEIQQTNQLSMISAGCLIIALLRTVPSASALLGHLQLDESDLLEGMRWYDHLRHLIDSQKQTSKHPGGIGRDLSFGWIPTLSRFGQNISEGLNGSGLGLVELEAHQEALRQLFSGLSGEGVSSLALVGPTGVGKTEVVYALADALMDPTRDIPSSIKYHQVFLLDASSLIAAAPGRGELEQLVTLILNEAFSAKNIIVCLDNAQLFFEEGVGSVDLSALLLPILKAGRLPIILTIDEQRYLQIALRTPDIINSVNRISLGEVSQSETMRVMQDQLLRIEYKSKVMFMYQALKESYRLSERYIYDLAMPGRALHLLEQAAGYAQDGVVTAQSVQQAIEKTMNVKISVASDEQERTKLLNLESLIHERMIGQDRAVTVVSDALRRARAGVRNQNRPIGTFLFLGPTGVGKTELAKSLASVYFGDEQKILRLDMNEFVSPADVSRLIADGGRDPNSLTAQVMKQPFSVILLDELEKAHSSVLTTLLQLLDEGILRDENNREVSFRDAIIIATSNAGADRIREYIERGYRLEQFEDQFVNELINSHIFQPEFLNRFDEIVVFSPLAKEELLKVVDLIIAGVNKTLAVQKVTVVVEEEAKKYLVEAGYDPRLGARPMRRVVQRAVENIVARAVLSEQVSSGQTVTITLSEIQTLLEKNKTADAIASGN